ncbi:hypothetical protein FGG08_002569 [Glutinoglossum americanum]|uniref:F-box protein n=1 Tax=Glutinoglossum americanum TaxID=1670608 RepID=A0A9P8L5G3_9PEZI|nr:hypothetical protein FGG08_002569 [Glutinoglossum americanum]
MDEASTVPPHPLDVKPAGNAFTAAYNLRNTSGGLFSALADELIIQILEFLDGSSLLRVGATCKVLYAFAAADDLWKTLFIEKPHDQFIWRGTWRRTFLDLETHRESKIPCTGLFSDLLYRPHFCTHTSILPYATNIPQQNKIPRLENLDQEAFSSYWVDKPFILTLPVKEWPVYQQWSMHALLRQYADVVFRAEAVDWPFHTYIEYMKDCHDESPLYLFDRAFVEKMKLKVGTEGEKDAAYWVPSCFGEDLFEVLENERPDSRWLIIGPERSGSTFHKDPNATRHVCSFGVSMPAWNAVLQGSKYWIMFPQSETMPPPPGVYVSKDQSEVTSPLSVTEWLLGFHAEARKTRGCLEGICGEGEVLHVPSGWWHLVVNLTHSVAITQNFVPRGHLAASLLFLRNRPEQVSGFKAAIKDPYVLYVQRMKETHPELLEEAFADIARWDVPKSKKKRKWDELIYHGEEKTTAGGFSFGFAEDESEECNA